MLVSLSAEKSVRCEGPLRGKFGSLLSLATTQEIWPLWNKSSGPTRPTAAQRSCLPLLPPWRETLAQPLPACFSFQRAPVSHWAPESLLSLGGRASRASTSWGNKGCLQPSLSFPQLLLSRAGSWAKPRGHGMEQTAHLKILCLFSAVSIWDISSRIGQYGISVWSPASCAGL